jgi:hypothetical protein
MYRLEDRIQFFHRRFGGKPLDRTANWWGNLASAVALRNQLTHPRKVPTIAFNDVSRALQAVVDAIDVLYQAIYKRPFPEANRGLMSQLAF